jgi:hypothetical protein
MRGPNMTYCMYENTCNALQQILNHLRDAVYEQQTFEEYTRDMSEYELGAFKQFREMCEEIFETAEELKEQREL